MIAKDKPIRMKKLRDSARGAACLLAVPGVCNYDTETTVLAHIPSHGSKGMGLKPHDCLAVAACSSCHDWLDGRTINPQYWKVRMEYFDAALQRQLVEWIRSGVLS